MVATLANPIVYLFLMLIVGLGPLCSAIVYLFLILTVGPGPLCSVIVDNLGGDFDKCVRDHNQMLFGILVVAICLLIFLCSPLVAHLVVRLRGMGRKKAVQAAD